jgi:hypothetical protein
MNAMKSAFEALAGKLQLISLAVAKSAAFV